MLQIEQITFSYGRHCEPVFADFSLQIEAGHIYGLLGKNGTGKSTLLYLMSGLLYAQRGEICFEGTDVKLRRPEVLSDVFLVPEVFDLPNTTLKRYVQLNAPFYPHFNAEVLQACLTDFELPADFHLGSLSMGQRKKAFMSFALASGCRLLLMDEPTNGLDIPSKSLFRRVVSRYLTDERSLIISTHQVRDVDMLLDHVLLLHNRRLLLNRSVADICSVLRFEEYPLGSSLSEVLYAQPSLQGHSVVELNTGIEEETPLNLELLFNCAEAGKLPRELTD